VGLWNLASSNHVWEKIDKVFGEHYRVTTGFFSNMDANEFFPNIDELFGDMALNDGIVNANKIPSIVSYVILYHLFQIVLYIFVFDNLFRFGFLRTL
jgi:hypothetical protein